MWAPRQSNSSSPAVGLFGKFRYNLTLLAMRARAAGDGGEIARRHFAELGEIAQRFEQLTGRRALDSSVVEVGFGARPHRAFGFTCFFGRVSAIDLDAPVLSLADLRPVFRRNGFERGIRSMARHLLFDAREWQQFHREMRSCSERYAPGKVEFVLGNAGSENVWDRIDGADLVFSSDVFEHIPPDELRSLMACVRRRIAPGGVVITTPMVFTGISGGHDLPWYPHRVETQDGGTAWGHLLDDGFTVNTYLNRLSRRDFRRIFEEAGFSIQADVAVQGRLGAKHLTEEKRRALGEYDEYELFSNRVEFVLT